MPIKLLLIEDDIDTVNLLTEALKSFAKYSLDCCLDGRSGLEKALANNFDIVIVDGNLPEVDGFDVCKQLRQLKERQLILMLTCRGDEVDRVLGLELGADDYIVKPFSTRELVARVNALVRRAGLRQERNTVAELVFGKLIIDISGRKISYDGKQIEFTAVEFDLITFLALHCGTVFSRSQLLEEVMGYKSPGYEQIINTHISRIRARLEVDPVNPVFLKTIRGVGYCFVTADELK